MAQEYQFSRSRRFTSNPLAVFPAAEAQRYADADDCCRVGPVRNDLSGFSRGRIQTDGGLGSLRLTSSCRSQDNPTIGAAILLAGRGDVAVPLGERVVVLEEKVGEVPVRVIRSTRGTFSAEFSVKRRPEFRDTERPLEDVAKVVGLTPDDLLEGWPPQCVSCGVPFLLLAVKDLGALARAQMQEGTWRKILAESWAPQIYLFTPETGRNGVDLRARMFAPGMGITEDPATGAAAAALAASLAHGEMQKNAEGRRYWTIEQGVEMGRPSQIQIGVEWRAQRDLSIHVARSAVRVSSGVFYDL